MKYRIVYTDASGVQQAPPDQFEFADAVARVNDLRDQGFADAVAIPVMREDTP